MKYKWQIVLIIILSMALLSACSSSMENVIDTADELISKLTDKVKSDKVGDESQNGKNPKSNNGGETIVSHVNDGANNIPIDFPLILPSNWQLVKIIHDGQDKNGTEYWEGNFCTKTDMEIAISDFESLIEETDFELTKKPIENKLKKAKHATAFAYLGIYPPWQGDISFFTDEHGSTCAKIYLTLGELK